MRMFQSLEARCIVCHLMFCCADCRWKHEQTKHGLLYNCPICRGHKYLCKLEELNNDFIQHLTEEHLPLHCSKCNITYNTMEDLINIDKCNSISELVKEGVVKDVDNNFDSIYNKIENNTKQNDEIVEIDKTNKTAVVTPVVRKTHLVDYEPSDTEDEIEDDDKVELLKTPHPMSTKKTPKMKKQRSGTPHVKKLLNLVRQRAMDEYELMSEQENNNISPKTTPSRKEDLVPVKQEMTTPTMPHLLKLAQVVTTSTPTHPVDGGWAMFPEQADSPLSEIENADSPVQKVDNEPSKSESEQTHPKLKSIIVTGSKVRLGSQDSTEKQVTFQDSNTDGGKKKVKFAEDTVFEQENKVKRVFRKPKRMLTPGPQRPKFCFNPRFQALINRFDNKGMTLARTPVTNRDQLQENTPPVGEPSNLPARAINFKDESPVVANYEESDDSYKTCIASPNVTDAVSALTTNIATTLQTCLHSAIQTTEENTEIQFKFVITKKKFTVTSIGESGDSNDVKVSDEKDMQCQKENIWSSVARAVKNAFWGESAATFASVTPHRSIDSIDSSSSSASKRKIDEVSDTESSPINHKRNKYEGRIKCRPPIRRHKPWVSALRSTKSAEQQELMQKIQEDNMNLSF